MYVDYGKPADTGGFEADRTPPTLGTWLRDLMHPVRPAGDYFDRLRANVEASAPICTACA